MVKCSLKKCYLCNYTGTEKQVWKHSYRRQYSCNKELEKQLITEVLQLAEAQLPNIPMGVECQPCEPLVIKTKNYALILSENTFSDGSDYTIRFNGCLNGHYFSTNSLIVWITPKNGKFPIPTKKCTRPYIENMEQFVERNI
jgi:hypothetical protein